MSDGSIRQISDAGQVAWYRYAGPINAAAQQLNAAIQAANDVVAKHIIRAEGLNPEDWSFDMDRVCLVPKTNKPVRLEE